MQAQRSLKSSCRSRSEQEARAATNDSGDARAAAEVAAVVAAVAVAGVVAVAVAEAAVAEAAVEEECLGKPTAT